MKKLNLFRDEPLLNTSNPQGTNKLSSRATFLQRKLYELNAASDLSANKPIDLLYKQMFYGRIDEEHNPVQLKQEKLKQIPQPNETIMAVDFVADAFIAFKSHWTSLANKGILQQSSPLYNLIPKAGWTDVNKFYYDMMIIYYDKFKNFVQTNKQDKNIKDFSSFMKVFTDFLDVQTPFLPFTRSLTNMSRFNNPNTSGIVIEIKTEKYGDDKVNELISKNEIIKSKHTGKIKFYVLA